MGIFEKNITPNDCTLAIALPLTRDEFLADLRPEARKDYAKFYRAQIWGQPTDEQLWTRYRDNFSKLFEGVAEEVQRYGVKVIRGVRLTDLPLLLKDRDVVSLVSHWRGSDIERDDFVNFPRFVERLSSSADEVVIKIRQTLSKGLVDQMQAFDVHSDFVSLREQLVGTLNELLVHSNLGNRPGFDESRSEQGLNMAHRSYLNRITLEAAFKGELKKGNQMEFFDGLQSAEDIRAKTPAEFAGFLDLIVCNSVLPGEIIKLMKRSCLIISSQFPANPRFRLLLYQAVIRALHLRPGSYVQTMMEVRQGLGNHLKNQ